MGGLFEKMKEHPWITALGVIIGLVLIISFMKGSSTTSSTGTSGASAANVAEFAAAAQENAQLTLAQDQVAANGQNVAAAIAINAANDAVKTQYINAIQTIQTGQTAAQQTLAENALTSQISSQNSAQSFFTNLAEKGLSAPQNLSYIGGAMSGASATQVSYNPITYLQQVFGLVSQQSVAAHGWNPSPSNGGVASTPSGDSSSGASSSGAE